MMLKEGVENKPLKNVSEPDIPYFIYDCHGKLLWQICISEIGR